MKSPIKIIKRKHEDKKRPDEDSNELKTSKRKKSVKRSTSEMTKIINGWIAELQKRKHAQSRSFSSLSLMPPLRPRIPGKAA
jgi:hypothetical protein